MLIELMELVYKPPGILGTQIAKAYKQKHNKNKVCICGKLDPMAEGQLLLLYDEHCKKMNNYLGHSKTYQFTVLWGFKTSSDDTLGLINNTILINNTNIDYDYIESELQDFTGTYNQQFHKYSAKPVHNNYGEKHSLWDWTNQDRLDEIDIPSKSVHVNYIKQLKTEKKNFNELKHSIISILEKIDTTNNTFCKNDAIHNWNTFNYENLYNTNDVYITTFEAYVSTGYYIRQFISDFGEKTELLGTALNINRIKIHIN